MIRIVLQFLSVLILILPTSLFAQTAAKIMIVDFERVLAECAEGKQAAEKFNVKFEEKKKDIDARQKTLETDEAKLRTQERVLSEAIKADLTRSIERQRTDLTRINEDAQKELGALREELLRPIAEKATAVLKAFAAEQGFTMVIDISADTNVVYANPQNDVTAELIRRVDALAKPQPKPPGGF